jgi:hypothetical protein
MVQPLAGNPDCGIRHVSEIQQRLSFGDVILTEDNLPIGAVFLQVRTRRSRLG